MRFINYFLISKLLNTNDSNILGIYVSRLIEKNNGTWEFNQKEINELTNLTLKIIDSYEDICPERIVGYFIYLLDRNLTYEQIIKLPLSNIFNDLQEIINNCEPYYIDDYE